MTTNPKQTKPTDPGAIHSAVVSLGADLGDYVLTIHHKDGRALGSVELAEANVVDLAIDPRVQAATLASLLLTAARYQMDKRDADDLHACRGTKDPA